MKNFFGLICSLQEIPWTPLAKAIASNQVTKGEAKLIYAAAHSRYATALRRFSRLVMDGEVPADLR
jgi:hypothetical protein